MHPCVHLYPYGFHCTVSLFSCTYSIQRYSNCSQKCKGVYVVRHCGQASQTKSEKRTREAEPVAAQRTLQTFDSSYIYSIDEIHM